MNRALLPLFFLMVVLPTSAQDVVPGARYALIAQHSGLCLDVEGSSEADGAPVVQSHCNGDRESQVFTFNRAGEGYVTLSPVHSGLCIGVGAAATDAAAAVTQYACHGEENQQLRVQRNDDGTYTMTARHTGYCLGVGAASTEPGAGATQWECHEGANQRWYAYRLGGRGTAR